MVETKKAVIIGYGSLGAGSWGRQIKQHPDWELAGVVDTNTELLEHLEEQGIDAYMRIDEVMQYGEKPDLAIIATPIYNHHVLVKETMDHDINVICEKNMASTIYQGRQMVQCAIDKPQLSTAIGTQYRYFPKNWIAKQFFSQQDNPIGELGTIRWASGGNWGESRTGWRRWLQDVYLEDMCTHWFDLLRYITGMDVVQVRADTFIPKFSQWQGSSTTYVNLALAHPDDYNHRHNWVWAQLYGDWQKRGPGINDFNFYGSKGEARIGASWLEMKVYLDQQGHKFEEDGFLFEDAGPIEGFENPRTGQGIILDMMKRGIETKGEHQPGTNFKEAFKSFAISMGAVESSRTGKAVWIPDYWKGLLDD